MGQTGPLKQQSLLNMSHVTASLVRASAEMLVESLAMRPDKVKRGRPNCKRIYRAPNQISNRRGDMHGIRITHDAVIVRKQFFPAAVVRRRYNRQARQQIFDRGKHLAFSVGKT